MFGELGGLSGGGRLHAGFRILQKSAVQTNAPYKPIHGIEQGVLGWGEGRDSIVDAKRIGRKQMIGQIGEGDVHALAVRSPCLYLNEAASDAKCFLVVFAKSRASRVEDHDVI